MERKQYVVLNGERSATYNATSGVPQGLVLGLMLFLIYINDSVQATNLDGNCIMLYADDLLLYRIINNLQDLGYIQQGIDNVGQWVTENDLCLNSGKFKAMIVTRQKLKRHQSLHYSCMVRQ